MGDQFADAGAGPSAGDKRKATEDPDTHPSELPADLVRTSAVLLSQIYKLLSGLVLRRSHIVTDNNFPQVEAWTNVPRLGKQVVPSPFIPCKPPLQAMANSKLDEGDR